MGLADSRIARALRAAAMLVAAVALGACASSDDDASDASVANDSAAAGDDAAAGDGDGDGDIRGDGDGDGDRLDGSADPLDASGEPTPDGGEPSDASVDASTSRDADVVVPALEDLPYAREVISFTPGASAGFGQTMAPEIVCGPPKGKGTGSGSLDVLSLGVGGEIVLGFGDFGITDGAGDDFIVFENAFIGAGMLFKELGEVAVSEDGETWHTFACDEAGSDDGEHEGCAGWVPTLQYDPLLVFPLDPDLTGGNAFDLETLGVTTARYVRIRDLETQPGSANTGGFDLDAVGLIHYDMR